MEEVNSAGLFTDISESIGIQKPSGPYPDGTFLTPEITPGGVAVFDYDNDGDLDIYQIWHAPPGPFDAPAPNRLYQQQADGTFLLVPNAAGLADDGFGHGVAIGDIDNDGDLDVFVTNYGPDKLYVNDGAGAFEESAANAGISAEHPLDSEEYGESVGAKVEYAEAFEICEYGHQPTPVEIRKLFPFLPERTGN